MLAFFLTLRCLLLVPVGAVDAQQFTVSTHYDDDRDVFVTTGHLKLPVSLGRVTLVSLPSSVSTVIGRLRGLIKKPRVAHSSSS